MKFILSFLLIFSSGKNSAQSDTIFLTSDYKKCERADAKFYRLITESKRKCIVSDYYMNGSPKVIAEVISKDSLLKNGKCTYFDENGNKTSEGNYRNNKYSGVWTTWVNNGTDSSLTEYLVDGSVNHLRIAKKSSGVDKLPEFPGGDKKMHKFLHNNIEFPESAIDDRKESIIAVTFNVTIDGEIKDILVTEGVRKDYAIAVVRAIKKMPKWNPGIKNGKPVEAKYKLIVDFSVFDSNGD